MMHSVDSPITDDQNDASTQRSLDPQDRVYFDNCFASLSSIVLFPLTGVFGVTRSDSKLKMAFKQVVKNTPILQTQVVGEGDNAVFRKVTDDDALPSMTIEPQVEKSKTAMMNRARSILLDQKAEMADGGQDALRLSVRLHAVRGPQDIALVFSIPHHFADGIGITSILAQLYVTQLLPKCCWGLLRLPEEQIQLPPSFMEMALKSEFASNCDAFRKVDVLGDTFLSKKYAEDKFRFQNYDLAAPDALSKLRGLDEHLVKASAKSLKRCCRELRKKGISLTSAFSALAIKVLAKLIAECSDDNGATATGSYLLATNPVDARTCGKWDDKDKRKLQSKRFPIVGNYAFSSATPIQFDAVLAGPLEEIAMTIKQGFARLQTDATFRIHEIAVASTPHEIAVVSTRSSNILCGNSSVLAPRIIKKLGINISSETKIGFQTHPRCWFYVISHGSQTVVAADISLPLPNLTEEATRNAIFQVSKGTALEQLLVPKVEKKNST